MRILVTGANGFIGKNLVLHINEKDDFSVIKFTRGDSTDALQNFVEKADAVIHLAGENRPNDVSAFNIVNEDLTKLLCDVIHSSGKNIPLILASSIQADLDNPYGTSKRAAEMAVEELARKTDNSVYIYRLPNVFGKWSKPNYNSVVATFCYNTANNLPIQVNNASFEMSLVYIDDVISSFLQVIQKTTKGVSRPAIDVEYSITLGRLSEQIRAFKNCRNNLVIENVGAGLERALYSTYVSFLSPSIFSYKLPLYEDNRGIFVEMLKTRDNGQFSYFTTHPGKTRGGHYHHSKTEKFLVLTGSAKFGFRNVVTNEFFDLFTSGKEPQVVDTVPGWIHDITNIGEEDMIVMLWANEIFDRKFPDTIAAKV